MTVIKVLADAMMQEIEAAGGDVRCFTAHPMGRALIEKTALSGQWRRQEFRSMVEKLLVLMPALGAGSRN